MSLVRPLLVCASLSLAIPALGADVGQPAPPFTLRDEVGTSHAPGGDVGRAYGAKTTPHMFVIDEKGVLRYAGGIDDDPRGRSTAPTSWRRR